MSVFFNPVEVNRLLPQSQNPYQIHKYNDDPFKLTQLSVESIKDQKRKIIQWLKRIPIMERLDHLTFTNKQFVCLVMHMYQMNKNRPESQQLLHFSIYQNEHRQFGTNPKLIYTQTSSQILLAQQQLLSSIIIMNKYTRFDSITLTQQITNNIDRLFQLFQIIEDGIAHQLTYEDYQQYRDIRNDDQCLFYREKQTQEYGKSIGLWIVEVLKTNISINYYKQREQGQSKIREFSSTEYAKGFQKVWKAMEKPQKKQFLNTIFKNQIINLMSDYTQIIRVKSQFYPQVYHSQSSDTNNYIQILLQSDHKKIFELVVFSTLKETQESYAFYKFQIYMALQERVRKLQQSENKNRVRPFVGKKKTMARTQSLKQQIISQLETKQLSNDMIKLGNYQQESVHRGHLSMSFLHHQIACSTNVQQFSDDKESFLKDKNKKKKKNKRRTLTPKQQEKIHIQNRGVTNRSEKEFMMSSQTTTLNQLDNSELEDLEGQELQERMYKLQINYSQKIERQEQIKPISQSLQQSTTLTSDTVLSQIVSKITIEAGYSNKHRKIIVNRIGVILSHLNLSYKLYGSCACGLIIPSSDIDISVGPTIVHYFYAEFCSYRQKIVKSLEYLKHILKQMKWVSEIVVIHGASIPLLTFVANPLQPFQTSPSDSRLNILRGGKNKSITHLNVDITIDSFVNMTHQIAPHLGFQATILMSQWLSIHPQIFGLSLFLKQLLYTHNCNKAYTGGISSFCLMVLIMGFQRLRKVGKGSLQGSRKQQRQGELLKSLLKFMAEFDETNFGIDLRRQNQPIFKRVDVTNKLVIISPLNGTNISQSCHQFPKIKQIFKQVLKLVTDIDQNNNKPKKQSQKLKSALFKIVLGS